MSQKFQGICESQNIEAALDWYFNSLLSLLIKQAKVMIATPKQRLQSPLPRMDTIVIYTCDFVMKNEQVHLQ